MLRPLAHYDQLISEELAGIISPADQAELDAAKAAYPEVLKLWQEKHAVFEENDIREWAAQKMTPPVIAKTPFPYLRVLLIAAVVAAFVFFLYKWNPIPKDIYISSRIELHLDNGKVIDLSYLGDGDTISLDLRKHDLPIISSPGEYANLLVPKGKRVKITLADGSDAFMNSYSCLRFPLSFNDARYRHVTVSGEAYLKVAPDANRPFSVILREDTVLVLGTEFNVKNYDETQAQVALVTGSVRLKTAKQSILLKPGYMGTFTKEGIDSTTFDTDEMLGWRRGVYMYKEQNLEEVFNVLTRWTGKQVKFHYHPPEGSKFTGQFDKNDLTQFFLSLEKRGIKCSLEGEVFQVRGK